MTIQTDFCLKARGIAHKCGKIFEFKQLYNNSPMAAAL